MSYLTNMVGIGFIFLVWKVTWAGDGRLFLIQPTAVDKDFYMVSSELDNMKIGFNLAINAFKAKFPKSTCSPTIIENFHLHSDAQLFDEVRRISALPGPKVMIGLAMTNYARVAAYAAAGTDLIGISTEAVTDELHGINPNFISLGARYQKHWEVTAAGLKTLNCTPDNTLGIFAFQGVWSGYYKKSFLDAGYKMVIDVNKFQSLPDIHPKTTCIFFGISNAESIKPLSKLFKMKWPGTIVGPHDWTYFSGGIRALLADHQARASRVYAPMIWQRNETEKSKNWANKYFGKALAEPIHASLHDTTIIALNYLCRHQNVLQFDAARWRQFGTLRTYQRITPSGNLDTDIHFVELPLVEWN